MNENANSHLGNVEELYKQSQFEEIIALLTEEELKKQKNAQLYAWKARVNSTLGYDVAVTILLAEKAIYLDPTYFMGYFARAIGWADKKEYEKAMTDYTKAIEINPKDAELYVWRGNLWYNKENYDYAILDYNKSIELNPDFADAYYNRGLAWFANKKYDKAIADYSKAIKHKPDYADAYYNDRGIAWKKKKKFNKAIADYSEAIKIKPDFENAYYNRGLAKKENNVDLEGSKQDFEKYLLLAKDESEIWTKYAKYYIEDLDEMIKDSELRSIRQSVDIIKGKLLIKEDYITHYTSLSVLKSLILDKSKFRISEGNFMNDPSEGKEFFNFLKYNPVSSRKSGSSVKTFSPKPFIGSFVTKDKHNDLNMWRFYGKEKGTEAKGCAITLRMQKFIDDIENCLLNEKKEARQVNETDINCYQVVYIVHDRSVRFIIPNLEKSKELGRLMEELKEKVNSYKGNNKPSLEKHLNSIAFLFKSDAYKNENEVRLVLNGIEFDKKYNMDVGSPLVYIELEPIMNIVSRITLGPKVDKISEWITALYYSYEKSGPKIVISHLPYK